MEILTTRLARLTAEYSSAQQKFKQRLTKVERRIETCLFREAEDDEEEENILVQYQEKERSPSAPLSRSGGDERKAKLLERRHTTAGSAS